MKLKVTELREKLKTQLKKLSLQGVRGRLKRQKPDITDIPSVGTLEEELKREKYKTRYYSVLRSTIYALITVAAAAVLVATLWMPVLQIMGTSMSPTLEQKEIVISVKSSGFDCGDIVAFYYQNKLLIKRCIAGPGQWVDIDEEGNVYVDGEVLDEPYLKDKAYGEYCDIELPFQVPENRWFMIGDNRSVSVDSRSKTVGCISEEMIVGKIVFRVWPIPAFGSI
jgi:signal peptidase I